MIESFEMDIDNFDSYFPLNEPFTTPRNDYAVENESDIPLFISLDNFNSPISEPQTDATNNLEINIPKAENINDEIKSEKVYKAKKTGVKEIGKKRGRSTEGGSHNKFSDDNVRRKTKHIVIKYVLKFINKKIIRLYDGNIGAGIFKKELLTINQKQITDATVEFNKMFLNKTLKDILSEDITTRFTNFPKDHNKKLIEDLMNKSEYFTKLFNLTFLQCLKHFRGSEIVEELKGLSGKDKALEEFQKDENYANTLDYYFMNYEQITNNKRSRTSKKNTNQENKREEEKGNIVMDQGKILLYEQ